MSGTPTHAQTVSVGDVRLPEGNGGSEATALTFTVTLSVPAAILVQADWKTADGTAVAGPIGTGDYTLTSGTVVFPIGNTSQTVVVKVHGDLDVESDEVFYVDLTGASGASVLKPRGVGAILDDDTVRPGVQAFSVVSDGDTVNGRNRLQWFVPASAVGAVKVVVRYNAGATCSPPTTPSTGTDLPILAAPVPDATHVEPHDPLLLDEEYCYSVWLDYGAGVYSTIYESMSARPFDSTGSVKWKFFTGTTTLAAPTVGYDAVIVPSNDYYIHALQRDPASAGAGTWPAAWRPLKLESVVQHRVPVVPLTLGSRAFVSTQNGWVHSVDTANGNLLWSTPLPEGAAQGAPAGIFTRFGGAYDYVLVGTSAGGNFDQLYALDPFTGAVIDSFPQAADSYFSQMGAILGMPSVDYVNRRVYFGSVAAGGSIWCLDLAPPPDALQLGWDPKLTPDIDGSVVLFKGRVYAGTVGNPGSGQGQLHSVRASDGDSYSVLLDGAVQGFVSPDWRGTDLYAATHGKTQDWVEAITDTGSLNPKWASEPVLLDPSVLLHHPFTDDIYVGVRDYGGSAALVKLHAGTGSVVSWVPLDSGTPSIGSPSLDLGYGMLYMGSEAGIIYAVELGF